MKRRIENAVNRYALGDRVRYWVGLVVYVVIVAAVVFMANQADARIKRDPEQVREFKNRWKCPATGKIERSCPGFIVDHKIPLACGGPDRWENMQWQSVDESRAKDRWERNDCSIWY